MSKGYGFRKINASIMRMDAMADYNTVKAICETEGLPVIPPGKSIFRIEDATAQMLKTIPVDKRIELVKGLSYYLTLPQ